MPAAASGASARTSVVYMWQRYHRHVQGACDARALQGLRRTVFLARRHQPGHLGLGQRDFLATEFGERDVLDDVVGEGELLGGGGHMVAPLKNVFPNAPVLSG